MPTFSFKRYPSCSFALLMLILQAGISAFGQLDDCPEPHRHVLREYKLWHAANKHSPDAQYLIQGYWHNHYEGTGDRIRGTMWLLRVAMAHRKVLLVDWTIPAPLTNFLLPNEIDWTFDGVNVPYLYEANSLDERVFKRAVFNGEPSALTALHTTKRYYVGSYEHFYNNSMWNVPEVEAHRMAAIGSCYFNYLFRFNPTVEERGQAQLHALYGQDPVGSYIAWHWWHFDTDGNDKDGKEGDAQALALGLDIKEVTNTLDCWKSLANPLGIDTQARPLLLISDFTLFRTMVQEKKIDGIVTPDIVALHHMEYASAKSQPLENATIALDKYSNIFVELYLLSRARCLLTSATGFSELALWAGGYPLITCHRDMTRCDRPMARVDTAASSAAGPLVKA